MKAALDTHKAARRRRTVFQRCVQPVLERIAAAGGLVVFSPVLLIAALCSLAESGFPVLFRQKRVGQYGKTFTLLKLRSMRTGCAGAAITAGGDSRVTKAGAILRKYKIDELPQLWNVLRGDMQLVGSRPELPAYVDLADPLWLAVLSEKPGLTDLASLVYRNEEEILARHSDSELAYRQEGLPDKLRLCAGYLETRTFFSDCRLLLMTARYSFLPAGFNPDHIVNAFLGGQNEQS